MSTNSPEPEVYMPNKGESNDSILAAIDNQREMSQDEIIEYRKKIDSGREEIPRKGKKKIEENKTIQTDDK